MEPSPRLLPSLSARGTRLPGTSLFLGEKFRRAFDVRPPSRNFGAQGGGCPRESLFPRGGRLGARKPPPTGALEFPRTFPGVFLDAYLRAQTCFPHAAWHAVSHHRRDFYPSISTASGHAGCRNVRVGLPWRAHTKPAIF